MTAGQSLQQNTGKTYLFPKRLKPKNHAQGSSSVLLICPFGAQGCQANGSGASGFSLESAHTACAVLPGPQGRFLR